MNRAVMMGAVGAAALLALMLPSGPQGAKAAGNFPGLPAVGGQTYCGGSSGNPSTCNLTVPAGPNALTGAETIPADTNLAGGAFPQSVLIPTSILGASSNKLVGGDFDTNIAQRLQTTKGIASLATISPTAAVMTADGWWTYSTGSEVTVTIANGTTEVLPALGTTHAIRVARPTGQTPSGAICLGQTLDQPTSAALIGNNAVFSFYELNGATQSASNGAFTAQISYSSGSAASGTQATLGYAGSEGSKYAIGTNATTFGTSGPTNQTAGAPVLVSGTSGSIGSNGFVTFPGSTTWTRYYFAAPIPVNIPGTTTAVTDVSVEVCFLPTATTSVTTDWIELQGLQLEAKPSVASATQPAGVIVPGAFEKRTLAGEQLIDYYYWYYNYENQAAKVPVAGASCTTTTSTTAGVCNLTFPVPMRIVPAVKYTDGFQAFTSTAYTAVGALSSLATYSNTYVSTPNNTGVMFSFAASVLPAVGTANFLMTLGTSSATGIISASAYP